MTVSVVVVTYNSRQWIDDCLESVLPQLGSDDELIIVDNGSADGTQDKARTFARARLIQQENVGYGAACNRGAREARSDVMVFLNPDTKVGPGSINALVGAASARTLVSPQLLLMAEPGKANALGLDLHFLGVGLLRGFGQPALADGPPQPVPGITGAAFAVRRLDFLALGGFDEGIFLYNEDVELSWRAQAAGWRVLLLPSARVWHSYAPRHSPAKMAQLEAGRRYLIDKYWTKEDRRRYGPSLRVMSVLSFVSRRGRPVQRTRVALRVEGAAWRSWTTHRLRVPGSGIGRRAVLAIANQVFRINAKRSGGPPT